ncbi:MAG: hypothetical protein U0W40_09625 [Acidimicrobiia bacterium]
MPLITCGAGASSTVAGATTRMPARSAMGSSSTAVGFSRRRSAYPSENSVVSGSPIAMCDATAAANGSSSPSAVNHVSATATLRPLRSWRLSRWITGVGGRLNTCTLRSSVGAGVPNPTEHMNPPRLSAYIASTPARGRFDPGTRRCPCTSARAV